MAGSLGPITPTASKPAFIAHHFPANPFLHAPVENGGDETMLDKGRDGRAELILGLEVSREDHIKVGGRSRA